MVLLQVLRSLVGNTFKTHNYASHTLDEHTACVHQLGQTDSLFRLIHTVHRLNTNCITKYVTCIYICACVH